jgi:hypothetical protein
MRRLLRWLAIATFASFGLVALGIAGIAIRYGGGEPFPDRTTAPELSASVLEVVADLELPPGNIAVSAGGRIFFSFHPEAAPPVQVAELVDGRPAPYPPRPLPDELAYQSVLSLRIDRQNRLWVLDNANHGTGAPRLLAFNLANDERVHRFDFPRDIAGWGSHLNDFQVSPDGKRIYIAWSTMSSAAGYGACSRATSRSRRSGSCPRCRAVACSSSESSPSGRESIRSPSTAAGSGSTLRR